MKPAKWQHRNVINVEYYPDKGCWCFDWISTDAGTRLDEPLNGDLSVGGP